MNVTYRGRVYEVRTPGDVLRLVAITAQKPAA